MHTSNREKIVGLLSAAIDWLFSALVFLVPLYFAFWHETNSIFTLDKVLLLRVIVSLSVLLFLAKVFIAGKVNWRFSGWFLAGFAVLAFSWLFSASFSAIRAFSFWGYYDRQQGFLTLIFYLLFIVLLLFSLENFKQVRRLIAAMLASSLFACLYGLTQYFNLDPLKWTVTGRIFSSFGQPDFFGHFLILVIPFSVYALRYWARRFLAKFFWIILLLAQLGCLFFTYSRSAWLGLAAEIFLALLFFLFLQGRKKIAFGLVIFAIVCLAFSFSQISFAPRPGISAGYSLKSRLATIFDFSQGSVKVRLNIWQAAIAEIGQESAFHKIFGYGPDSLFEVFSRHYQSSWALDENINSWPDRAHNLFLDIILAYGFFGLAVFLAFFAFLFRQVWIFFKTGARGDDFNLAIVCLTALSGYFFNNLFSFSDTPQYLYFYLILGFLIFAISRGREAKEIRIGLTVFSRVLIFVFFLALVGIFIFYYNFRSLLADYYFQRSSVVLANDCTQALSDNTKAIAWGGGDSLYYQNGYLANGLTCFDRLSLADQLKLKDNMLLYLSSLPADKFFSYAESKAAASVMLASLDKAFYPLAESVYAALAQKYPAVSSVYRDWGNFSYAIGNYDEAIAISQKGLATLPLAAMAGKGFFTHRDIDESWQIGFYDVLGAAYAKKNDDADALSYFQKIILINPDYSPVYSEIADIYQQKKDFDQALWYNKKGFILDPNNYSLPLAIGILYLDKGETAMAGDYFNKVLKLNPGNQQAQSLLAGLKQPVK